jgi:hypothetical protein
MDAREARELRKLQIQARLEADIKASTDFIFGRAPGPTPNLNHVVSERAGKLASSANTFCSSTCCKLAFMCGGLVLRRGLGHGLFGPFL